MIYELGSRGSAVLLAQDKNFLHGTQKTSETFFFFGHIQIAVKVGLSVRASLDKTAETTQDTRLSLFMAANFVGVEVGTYTEHWLSVIPTAECF